MATHCPFHGEGACHVCVMNWKVCRTDDEFLGANTSFWQTARYQNEMEQFQKFLGELFVYGRAPIVWTDDANRRNRAPLYLVSHHGGGGKKVPAHSRWRQWGCIRCGWTTNQLYPASWDYDQCLAGRQEEVEFLLPMLRRLKSFQVFAGDPLRMRRLLGNQEASPFKLACNNAATAAQPPPPLPAAPPEPLPAPLQYPYTVPQLLPRTPEAHQRVWERYWYAGNFWWHNTETGDHFWEATGTQQVPVTVFGGCCGKKARVQDSSRQDDSDSESTATGGGSTSVADSSIGTSVASQGPAAAAAGRPSKLLPIPESDCTHRTFYRNLYNEEAGTHEPPIGIEVTDL